MNNRQGGVLQERTALLFSFMLSPRFRLRLLIPRLSVVLACGIIMLHVVVPHHHHDCAEGVGLVFENELACHCHDVGDAPDGDSGRSHHPLDGCGLQHLLSQLTLASDEKWGHALLVAAFCLPTVFDAAEDGSSFCARIRPTGPRVTLPPGSQGAQPPLRAPPAC